MDNQTSQTEGLNPEAQEGQQQGTEQGTGQETSGQQEQQEKLYAGRFKTPEELEEAYKHSSTEGQRLNQRMKQLEQQLAQARTPARKEAIQEKIDDLEKYFDKDTSRVLKGYIDNRLSEFQTSTQGQFQFQQQVSTVWEETKKDFPEVANPQSKLYQRANEILFERGLAILGENGGMQLTTPYAYRMAVEAAFAELNRQSPEDKQTAGQKSLAGKVQGKGGNFSPRGKLTIEQYMALTDDQKDAYDTAQRG